MDNKSSVCESIEPPGSSNILSNLTATHSEEVAVQEHFPLFEKELFLNSLSLISRSSSNNKGLPKKESSCVETFRRTFFPSLSVAEWNNWKWQIKNRITSFEQLERYIKLTPEEKAASKSESCNFPLSITPYYLSLFWNKEPYHPLRKCMVPQIFESLSSEAESEDPLSEEAQSPVEGLVHRYPDRVLFLSTMVCSCYCRYCTRSRIVGSKVTHQQSRFERWGKCIDYIRLHSEIRDVLISGGDPLMLSDEEIQWLLSSLWKIPHIEMMRIGTKIPMVLPQRITPQLVKMLRKYHPLYLSIHVTHPEEITVESAEACARLADAGIPLGSQTVLLSGVNNSVEVMKKLVQGLLRIRVRPYYIYQCDPIKGSGHFRTSVQEGIDIIKGLRGHTTGYAVPTFVIDAPGGGGKIPVMPNYICERKEGKIYLKNYNNGIFVYPDEKGKEKDTLLLMEGAGI